MRDPMAARGPILICTLISLFAPGLRVTFQPAGEPITRVRFVVPESYRTLERGGAALPRRMKVFVALPSLWTRT